MAEVWYENPPGAAPAQGLYSHVGLARGGIVAYVAGQLSVGPKGEVVGVGQFDAQFRQVFANLQATLGGIGAQFKDVVKFTTYLVHSQGIDNFIRLRRETFPSFFGESSYPPNTLLIVDRLVKEEFLLEVEAVAMIDR
jgi:enamine deaminase RidA (YjgF/YER057c/UK114 family)